jgi:2-keto-3-deoxy-L-rhamnonate aldolase RhmA
LIENPVKHTLGSGGIAVGAMLFEFATLGMPRMLASAGADFVIFDQEHTGWSVETLKPLIEGSKANGVVPFVRVPAEDAFLIGAVLDAGAMGVMAPSVEDAAHAKRIIEAAKFPPQGNRSYGFVHSADASMDQASLMSLTNREQVIIALVESAVGVRNCEEIAAVDGIDVLWVGPNDLAASLGIPGGFDRPQFQLAVERVVATAQAHDKAAGMAAVTNADAKELLASGFRCLCFRDVSTYEESLRQLLDGTRTAAAGPGGPGNAGSDSLLEG